MSVKRIAGRYAKSLLDLAVETGQVDTVLKDINHFGSALSNRDLYLLVKSPIVNTAKKQSIFKALFGEQYSAITQQFIDIILRKGREFYLPEIAAEFGEQYNTYKGITKVKVTSAVSLSPETIADIKAKLLASDITAQEIQLETVVDPAIIGGLVLTIGDRLYDASVSHKLESLRKTFNDNTYVVTA